MSKAKFTITYYYLKYEGTNDIDKRYQRTATVYAGNLIEAIEKVKNFDSEYIKIAENGVQINERLEQKNKQIL